MMGKVHYWIVCDAVAYIKSHGDDVQKRALQTFQSAYGENEPVEAIPKYRTAMEHIAGFESCHTDKFGDLSLRLPALPWGAKRDVTGLAGHLFTAFNHFINPYPGLTRHWSTSTNGYSYDTSSMKGCDSFVVKGISEHLQGLVDAENSLILERIRRFWAKGDSEWERNFQRELLHTAFAPWSVLVQFYYSNLLSNHYDPLEVRGPNKHVVGLQLLGPVMHAAGDACSPQHVRPALGFGHQVWENYVQSRVYNREIEIRPALIREIMSREPFDPWLTVADGPLEGKFDVGTFVYMLSVRTADKLKESTAQSWTELWQAGENFWKWYLTGAAMSDDAHYLYNQAVAGTIHVMVRAHLDLLDAGIFTSGGGLANPEKMPDLDLIQDESPAAPMKMESPDDLPAEETRPIPLSRAKDILGFEPEGDGLVQERLDEANRLFKETTPDKRESGEMSRVMAGLEESLVKAYGHMESRTDPGFCPLRAVEGISIDSDMSAHFGAATFRLPSSAECNDPDLLREYIDQLETHEQKAHKLQLTQAMASLRFYRAKLSERQLSRSRIDQVVERMQQDRDGEVARKAEHTPEISARRVTEAQSRAAIEKVTSTLRDMISSIFAAPMALGTVAAMLLLVVIFFPRGAPVTVGLSPVKWAEPSFTIMAPKGKPPKPPRLAMKVVLPRVATIVFFKDFEDPVDQDLIDSLYGDIEPTAPMLKKYEFIPPFKMEKVVRSGKVKTDDPKEMMQGLRKTLNASRALTFTVVAKGDRFGLSTEFTDIKTGKTRTIESDKDVGRAQLPSEMRKAMQSLLDEAPKR